jgi:transcriptional regulator with XRE-family HTH domain
LTAFGHAVNQDRVAEALGLTSSSISSYEKGIATPPAKRLRDYAIFFSSRRWVEPGAPRTVSEDFLRPDEHQRFRQLQVELLRLGRSPTTHDFWKFPDQARIRIACGRLNADEARPFGHPDNHNHMYLANAADIDSLFEMWGHLRRLNPTADVQYRLHGLSSGDLQSHIVVLGNMALTQGEGRLLPNGSLPVRQVHTEGLDGEVFEATLANGTTKVFGPAFADGLLSQDVGLLSRLPHPHYPELTLTVCSGVFTKGVFGAVRCLTDRDRRKLNADYLRETFGSEPAFALLMRVSVIRDRATPPRLTVVSPDLRLASTRLFERDLNDA